MPIVFEGALGDSAVAGGHGAAMTAFNAGRRGCVVATQRKIINEAYLRLLLHAERGTSTVPPAITVIRAASL